MGYPPKPVKDKFKDGKCPWCGKDIPDYAIEGDECPFCTSIFKTRPDDWIYPEDEF